MTLRSFTAWKGIWWMISKILSRTSRGQSLDSTFVVFDIETTGFSAVNDRIIEIGAVKVENGMITEKFSEFVNPERPILLKSRNDEHQ